MIWTDVMEDTPPLNVWVIGWDEERKVSGIFRLRPTCWQSAFCGSRKKSAITHWMYLPEGPHGTADFTRKTG